MMTGNTDSDGNESPSEPYRQHKEVLRLQNDSESSTSSSDTDTLQIPSTRADLSL
jgi:hypothetical protein